MDDLHSSEEAVFVVEDVQNIIKETVEGTLQSAVYQHNKVPQWTNNVVEQCLKRLTALNKPFKYVVTCIIVQKNGTGLHATSSCYWDNRTDGSYSHKWENKSMHCITTVFGLTI
jgi:dynein light chain Tctex-type 1